MRLEAGDTMNNHDPPEGRRKAASALPKGVCVYCGNPCDADSWCHHICEIEERRMMAELEANQWDFDTDAYERGEQP